MYKKTDATGWYSDSSCNTAWTSNTNVKPNRSGWTFRGFYKTSAQAADIEATQTNGEARVITQAGATTNTGTNWTVNAPTNAYAGWARDCNNPIANGSCQLTVGQTTTYTTSCNTGYTISGNGTYNPTCTANTYTVKYNANKPSAASHSVSGTTANSTHTYDVAKNLTANGYSLTGWTFKGWATSANGNKEYDDEESVTNLTSTNGATVNLYAVWAPNHYRITLDDAGATTGSQVHQNSTWGMYERYDNCYIAAQVLNNVELEASDCLYSIYTKPTKTGYDFGGYYTAQNGDGDLVIDSTGAIVAPTNQFLEDSTIYAKWTASKYTITLNDTANAGTGGSGTIYTTYNINVYKDSARILAMTESTNGVTVPTKASSGNNHYVFTGYFNSASGSSKYIEKTGFITSSGLTAGKGYTSNQTWYAQFGTCTCTPGANVASCSATGVSGNKCVYTYTCEPGYHVGAGSTTYTGSFTAGTAGVPSNTSPACNVTNYNMNYTCNEGETGYTYEGTAPTAQTAHYLDPAPLGTGVTLPGIGNCQKVYGEGTSDYCADCFDFLGWSVDAESRALGIIEAHTDIITTWGKTGNTTWCKIAGVNDDWGSTSGACEGFTDDTPFTLRPVYEPKTYTLLYAHAPSTGPDSGNRPGTYVYTEGRDTISAADLSLAHGSFEGWCKDDPDMQNCTGSTETSVGPRDFGPHTFYAKWACDAGYSLSYDANDNPVCTAVSITCSAGYYLPAGGTSSDDCAPCLVGDYCEGGTWTYDGNEHGLKVCATEIATGWTSLGGTSCTEKKSCFYPITLHKNGYSGTITANTGTGCKVASNATGTTNATLRLFWNTACTLPTFTGFTQTGYTNSAHWSAANTIDATTVSSIGAITTSTVPTTTTYYVTKPSCAATYYKNNSTTCTLCRTLGGGLYTQSAAGNKTDNTVCYVQISGTAGKYIVNKTDTALTACPTGSYCAGGTINWPNVGNISACPTGYTYGGTGLYAQNQCKASCSAGQCLPTAGGQCVNAGAGNWSAGGTVAYGSTLACNACASGLTTIGYGHGADEADDCGRILHVGENHVYLRSGEKTHPSLHVKIGSTVFYGNMSTTMTNMSDGINHKLKMKYNNATYSVYDDSAQN